MSISTWPRNSTRRLFDLVVQRPSQGRGERSYVRARSELSTALRSCRGAFAGIDRSRAALQPDRDSDQVLLVNLSTLQTGSVTKVIEQNHSAGGVHRARNKNVFSWADLTAGPGGHGRVFVIR